MCRIAHVGRTPATAFWTRVGIGVIVTLSNKGVLVIDCRTWLCALAFVAVAAPTFAQTPQAPVGRIKIASGSVFIVRAGSPVAAQAGQPIFEADTLRTGATAGVTLKDDTRSRWGRAASCVDKFVYSRRGVGLVLNVVRGVMARLWTNRPALAGRRRLGARRP
jgi:hypothetical protein